MPKFLGMTALSLVFYIPINLMTKKLGKKKMIILAFILFTIEFAFTSIASPSLPLSTTLQAVIIVVFGSFPMAIFGSLPQAMVADCAEYDSKKTGESRQGMFFAARTFCFKLGQSIAMLLFTSLATIGANAGSAGSETGYRIVAIVSACLCLTGGIVLVFYKDRQ